VRSHWHCLVTLLILACWHLAIRPGDTGYRADSMYYLGGAESLAMDGRYSLTTHENSPSIGLYPPLQSAYLAVVWALAPLFPENVPVLQWSMILVMLALGAGFLTLLRSRGVSPRAQCAADADCRHVSHVGFISLILFSPTLYSLLSVSGSGFFGPTRKTARRRSDMLLRELVLRSCF
jgi:hypothetical protein